MIAVRRIGGPIRIRIMRSRYADRSAYFGNSIELSDKRHYIRYVFGDVATDDLIEFVIGEWIRNRSQIVNHISVRFRIGVNTDRARPFVPAATDVENSLHRAFTGDCFSHRCGPSVCVLSSMTELEIALGHESMP